MLKSFLVSRTYIQMNLVIDKNNHKDYHPKNVWNSDQLKYWKYNWRINFWNFLRSPLFVEGNCDKVGSNPAAVT